jgi:hypothetical protein
VRVRAAIGTSTWKTSIFPDSQVGYVLPVKRPVRVAEALDVGDTATARFIASRVLQGPACPGVRAHVVFLRGIHLPHDFSFSAMPLWLTDMRSLTLVSNRPAGVLPTCQQVELALQWAPGMPITELKRASGAIDTPPIWRESADRR